MDPYTGPYWSDGKFQPSVEFGTTLPRTWRAFNSRLHDTAFAHFQDDRHRTAADWIYRQALALDDSVVSQVVRHIPIVGNHSGHLLSLFPLGLGALAAPIAWVRHLMLMNEINSGGYETEIQDVLQLYSRDPDQALSTMGGAVTHAVYGDDWSSKDPKYLKHLEWQNAQGKPKEASPAVVETKLPPIPTVYDGKPHEPSLPPNPGLRGALPPVPQPPGTKPPADPGGVQSVTGDPTLLMQLPPIARNDLSVLRTSEEEFSSSLAYHPYKPLKPLTRRPPDARTVALYNKYNKKKITLDEALHKFYGN